MILPDEDTPKLHDDEEDEEDEEGGGTANHTRLLISSEVLGIVFSPYLLVAAGEYSVGRIAPARHGAIIGRAPDVDLMLLEEGVSRKHARVIVDGEQNVWLEDIGSKNGIVVDGRKVSRCCIQPTSLVEIGSATLTLVRLQASERLTSNLRGSASDGPEPAYRTSEFVEMINLALSSGAGRPVVAVLVTPAKKSTSPLILRRLVQLCQLSAKTGLVVGRLKHSVLGLLYSKAADAEVREAIDLLQQAATLEEAFEGGPRPPLLTKWVSFTDGTSVDAALDEAVDEFALA